MKNLVTSLFLSLTAAAGIDAQGAVWVVDQQAGAGSDFTTIEEAVAAASDGDFVLIRAGDYGEFLTIDDKALTLQAEAGAVVRASRLLVRNLAPGKSFVARGFTLHHFTGATFALDALSNAGTVWFEDCHVESALPFEVAGVRVQDSQAVHFARLQLDDPLAGSTMLDPAFQIIDSTVVVVDSVVNGASGPDSSVFFAGDGGAAIQLFDGNLRLVASTVRGGHGGNGTASCVLGGDSGPGVRLSGTGASILRVLGSTVTAGTAGTGSGGCADGTASPDIDVVAGTVTTLGSHAPTLVFESPLRAGNSIDYSIQTLGGSAAWLVASHDPFGPISLPLFTGSLLLRPPWNITFLGLVPLDGELADEDIPFVLGLAPGVLASRLMEQVAIYHPSTGLVMGGISAITIL